VDQPGPLKIHGELDGDKLVMLTLLSLETVPVCVESNNILLTQLYDDD